MEALSQEIYRDSNITNENTLKIFSKYDEENGRSMNDILKDILKSSLQKNSESII